MESALHRLHPLVPGRPAFRPEPTKPSARIVRRAGRAAHLAVIVAVAVSGCSDTGPSASGSPPDPHAARLVRTTAQGAVRGVAWDENTLAWLGIPYAAPPVGALRWKATRDPDPWAGVRDAGDFSGPCSQVGGFLGSMDPETFGTPIGSEDCLYLNLWRPRTAEQGLPVFLYIHGGMNSVGEAATSLYHGATLSARARAVVVTANFRLGPLGFFRHASLDTGDPLDESGAYGLLDILHALRWVRRNAAAFGGDPGNVTVGGESAGAFNVCSLLGSPLAEGLFHRAVALSPAGTVTTDSMEAAERSADEMLVCLILSDDALAAETEAEARRLVARNGPAWTAAYWRGRSPAELLACAARFSSLGMNEMGLLVQENRLADGTVIPADFADRFARGEYNRVPLLIGSNTEEYKMFLFTGILPPRFVRKDEQEIGEILRTADPEDLALAESDFIDPGSRDAYELAGTLLGRLMFDASIDALLARILPHQEVYRYGFAWNGQPAPLDFLLGAGHMTAVPFFFGNFRPEPDSLFRACWNRANRTGREALSAVMMGALGNFLWTGDPNAGPFEAPHWPPCPGASPCPAGITLETNP